MRKNRKAVAFDQRVDGQPWIKRTKQRWPKRESRMKRAIRQAIICTYLTLYMIPHNGPVRTNKIRCSTINYTPKGSLKHSLRDNDLASHPLREARMNIWRSEALWRFIMKNPLQAVLRRLESIFTSVYAAVEKLKKAFAKNFSSAWLTILSWTMSISLTEVEMKCFTSRSTIDLPSDNKGERERHRKKVLMRTEVSEEWKGQKQSHTYKWNLNLENISVSLVHIRGTPLILCRYLINSRSQSSRGYLTRRNRRELAHYLASMPQKDSKRIDNRNLETEQSIGIRHESKLTPTILLYSAFSPVRAPWDKVRPGHVPPGGEERKVKTRRKNALPFNADDASKIA
ncbi:hypothetical protein Tco_1370845 [Tanacetum coccineum]